MSSIDCYYCEEEIETTGEHELHGFFWMVGGKWIKVGPDGDKEAVCNKCLEGMQ